MKSKSKNGPCPLPRVEAKRWILHTQAANALGVTTRQIKRWMRRADARGALLAVRDGHRWRTPWPEDISWEEADGTHRVVEANVQTWEFQVRRRLAAIGITPPRAWERELDRRAKLDKRRHRDVHHVYVAACNRAVSRGRVTRKAKLGIDVVCAAARETLRHKPTWCTIEDLKLPVARQILRYWPRRADFACLPSSYTMKMIEQNRQTVDFERAVRHLRRRNKPPTAHNLRPLLHRDFMADFNDTKERLPAGTIDFRQPQTGISNHEFKQRYPLRQRKWRKIITRVYRYSATPAGTATKVDPMPISD